MYLKIVNNLRSLSITTRLSLLYAVLSFLMLFMASLYAYWALTDTLSNANQKFLFDEIRVFKNILQKHSADRNLLTQEVEWVPEELEASEYHYYARIRDKNKQIYAMTQGMEKIFKDVSFPSSSMVSEPLNEAQIWQSPLGGTYLLTSAIAKVGNGNDIRYIDIALDITQQQKIIEKYRINLFFVFLLELGIAIALGTFIARRGMRSLNDITSYAQHISISKLNAINIKQCPKELRNLVQAFNNMLQRIDNAFIKLSQFSNELAHEMRTPINNLMGEAELALSKDRSITEYKEIITSSLEEYLKLSRMIENIFLIARTENPNSKLTFTNLDLNLLFKEIFETFEPLISEKEISLDFSAEGRIKAEANLLRRMLNNLLSNAIRYTPEGGKISLQARSNKEHIIMTLEDNGIGIQEEHLPHIFNRFYRIKQDDAATSYGMGLGLAIVKSVVELHKGTINVQSTFGVGTKFELIFPSG